MRKKEPELVRCPTCNRKHLPHEEYGQFCCQSCLQVPIRPLIPLDPRTTRTTNLRLEAKPNFRVPDGLPFKE